MSSPIKRHESLRPLSHDHHHGLLLCWKIRMGFRNEVDSSRIKSYADWFYIRHLVPHFEVEEKYVFPILSSEHEMVKRACAEHRKLKRLFEEKEDVIKNLGLIEEKLEAHIRFEERILFNEIQNVASPAEFEQMVAHHAAQESTGGAEEWPDEFWVK